MGLIKLSAEFRRRIDRASGHSNTILELSALHTNPAFDQISQFVVSMKRDAVRRNEGVVPLSVLVFCQLDNYLHSTNLQHSRDSYYSLTLFHILFIQYCHQKKLRI